MKATACAQQWCSNAPQQNAFKRDRNNTAPGAFSHAKLELNVFQVVKVLFLRVPSLFLIIFFVAGFFFLPGVVSWNFFPPISREKKVSCRFWDYQNHYRVELQSDGSKAKNHSSVAMWEQGKSRNYLPEKVTASQSRQSGYLAPPVKQGSPNTEAATSRQLEKQTE